MKIAILAGGVGSRLAEETVLKPKPITVHNSTTPERSNGRRCDCTNDMHSAPIGCAASITP